MTFEAARDTLLRLLGDPRASVGAQGVVTAEIVLRLGDGSIRRGEYSTLKDVVQFLIAGGMT
ncbi:MAG: hypothetical protein ABIT20_07355 [Gemmatimonadaceae bacterium]